ncbi:NMDA-type glutamate receptor precursor [Aplysia californica]|uniref:Glutamate [NMDA] receptor subunit 1 n=1 Tax=Aplysia californica TaxID=6500 RepID=Q7YXV6_APLCA|nr:NMDA-type glutamate receptor precursor [Aplysia californica]AAO62106.1 NMDA-like glutamate receptor protein [Aplysia californica]
MHKAGIKMLLLAATYLACCVYAQASEQVITVGASLSSEKMEFEFKQAVNALNRRHLKSRILFNSTTILMDSNPIRSALDICDKLLAQHVYTVVASHPNSTDHSPISVSYTCGYYNIPVVGISARDSAFSDVNVHKMFLRTVPPFAHQADVWLELLVNLTWHKVIFVYSADEEGRSVLSRFQTLAEEHNIRIEPSVKYAPGEKNYTSVLAPILKHTSRVILLSASTEDAEVIYRDADVLGMTGEGWAWIVSEQAFDAYNIPVGFLGVHLVNGTNEVNHIKDAVQVIGHAFWSLLDTENISNPPTECKDIDSWTDGEKVYNELIKTQLNGETGQVSFNSEGDRLNPMYDIMNINGNRRSMSVGLYGHQEKVLGLRMMGRNITWPGNTQEKPKGEKISRNLTIVTLKEKPFVEVLPMPKDGVCRPVAPAVHAFLCKNASQDNCCMGYCMDMLARIAEKVKFNFTIHLSKDGLFGSFEKHNGSDKKYWNGMMGELMTKEADLIVAPLTINPERANDIDFTKPFKYQGLNILVRKTQKDSSLASFLQSFQDTLWILVGLSVHVVALVLYLLDRFSPFGRFKLAKSDDTEEDALNLSSAMWFSWGVLLNSGIGEGTPRSFSARVLGMVWAGFAMIIVASYTANLAAFLVLDRPEALISGIDDPRLRNPNKKFKYATVKGSATEMYFKRQVELSTMYRNMDKQKKYYTAEDAIEDIRIGELQAFIWDSPRLEYEAASDCDLTTAGDLFGRSGLGIGLPKNSPWTHEVSMAVLDMHESGFMEQLDNRWILVDSKSSCPESNSAPATLGLTNMAGVFMMVAGGIVAGVLLIFIEIAYKRHRGLKEKELELARNAADRWRGNIEKRRTLRQTLQKQREEQMRTNSISKQPASNTSLPMAPNANTAVASAPSLDSNNTNTITPSYRRLSLLEATTKSDCLPPPPPSDYRPPGYVPARSGRTVTWHNPSHNPDNVV